MFPSPGSLGEHSNVLPHIILKRSTLPWERQADPGVNRGKDTPWLALLLFEEQEIGSPRTLMLRDSPQHLAAGYCQQKKVSMTTIKSR